MCFLSNSLKGSGKGSWSSPEPVFFPTFTACSVSGPPHCLQQPLLFPGTMFSLRISGLWSTSHHSELSPKHKENGSSEDWCYFFILYFHSIINFKLCFQLGTCIHGWRQWLRSISVLAAKVWSLEADSASLETQWSRWTCCWSWGSPTRSQVL